MVYKNLIDINPQILKWAREEAGYDDYDGINEIITSLGVDRASYNEWENNGREIPFGILRKISKKFRRQVAVFFLTAVPKKVKKPKDFRNFVLVTVENSKETILAIRRANWYTNLLQEINGIGYYQKKYSWLKEYNDKFGENININNDTIATWIRNKIGTSLELQMNSPTQNQIYKIWRENIEDKLGISVFQFKMPSDEIQGFSLIDEYPFCITVNNKNAITGRIFTIFHELGHILKHQSGMCHPEKLEKNQQFEFECNSFAGKLLIPTELVVQTDSADEIFKYAKQLKVSSEAYLRRLYEMGYLSDKQFYTFLAEIRSKVVKTDKPFVHLTPLQKSLNSRGNHLFDSVVDAARNNKISFSLASDVLGIRLNYLLNL